MSAILYCGTYGCTNTSANYPVTDGNAHNVAFCHTICVTDWPANCQPFSNPFGDTNSSTHCDTNWGTHCFTFRNADSSGDHRPGSSGDPIPIEEALAEVVAEAEDAVIAEDAAIAVIQIIIITTTTVISLTAEADAAVQRVVEHNLKAVKMLVAAKAEKEAARAAAKAEKQAAKEKKARSYRDHAPRSRAPRHARTCLLRLDQAGCIPRCDRERRDADCSPPTSRKRGGWTS